MRTFYYEFADGYYCFTSGRMPKHDRICHAREHGEILVEKMM